MGAMCWDANPKCFVKGQKRGETPCPAYNENKGCWQVDWSFIITSLPDEERARWKKIMKEQCPACPVYAEHKDELTMTIHMVLAL